MGKRKIEIISRVEEGREKGAKEEWGEHKGQKIMKETLWREN
jgi:hypothetical protein